MRVLALLFLFTTFATTEDFDLLRDHDRWLTHPVLGGPAFQEWQRFPNNPIVQGKPPFEWPVNGTLFIDPQSDNWYLYVGRYPKGYAMKPDAPMNCIVLRSTDEGKTWEDLGQILPPAEPFTFDGETAPIAHAPDVQIIYADGKYHGVFDWVSENTTWQNVTNPGPDSNNGVGYMWAEKPEGPWHIAPRPVYTTRDMKLLNGKYRRLYVSSIVRRANDWLVLTDVDSGDYFGWGLVGMTAKNPEGPYSEPKLLLSCEGDNYYPPLMEHFPAYTRNGKLYMAATSVAKNRGVQGVFAVDLERAMEPDAWRLDSLETLLNPVKSVHEIDGIWGQASSIAFPKSGAPILMFPSRDESGLGTINLARRLPKRNPKRLWVGGGSDPVLALAPIPGTLESMQVTFSWDARVTILLSHLAPLGPSAPRADAAVNDRSLTKYTAFLLRPDGQWKLATSTRTPNRYIHFAEGPICQSSFVSPDTGERLNNASKIRLEVKRLVGSQYSVTLDSVEIYSGPFPGMDGSVGILADYGSKIEVSEFRVKTSPSVSSIPGKFWLPEEGLVGAAQGDDEARWRKREDAAFRYGYGYESRQPGVRAKWNVVCSGVAVWSPKLPGLGTAEILLDGQLVATVDLASDTPVPSAPIYTSGSLPHTGHAVVVRPKSGFIIIDTVETQP